MSVSDSVSVCVRACVYAYECIQCGDMLLFVL